MGVTGIGIGIGLGPFDLSKPSGSALDVITPSNGAWWVVKERDGSGNLVDQTGGGRNLTLPGGSANPVLLDHDNAGTDYFWFPGTTSNYLSVPDSAALDITGDIDIIASIRPNNWTSGTRRGITDKRNANDGFILELDVNNKLKLWWGDGTSLHSVVSTVAPSTVFSSDGWVRATLDVDNGAGGHTVTFYTSSDGASWSQLGATGNAGAFTTSITANAQSVFVGNAAGQVFLGRIYRAIIKDGIDGTTVLDVNASDADPDATTFTEASSNAATVTINRSSTGYKTAVVDQPKYAGATDDYMATATDALFDINTADSATIIWVGYNHGTSTANTLMSIGGGLFLREWTSPQFAVRAADGVDTATDVSTNGARGSRVAIAGRLDRSLDEIEIVVNGTESGSPTDASTIGDLTGGSALDLFRTSVSGSYSDVELIAAAFIREALTTAEISDIADALITANGGTP